MGKEFYIYYLGWNLPKNVPFMNTIGLAIYDKETGDCRKYSKAAILNRNDVDPLSISYPYVLKDGNTFRMWYGSNTTWGNTTFEHYDFHHSIKYAFSRDGINFIRNGDICISENDKSEYAFARPSVIFENNIYKMWYTFRGEFYRIGYAESEDGLKWIRKDDQVDLQPSGDSWESYEVSYPYVFTYEGKHYMLYCGNAYGKTGFGIAVEE